MSSQQRYVCKLRPEELAKAVKELNEPENNDERLARIDELRDAFINSDSGLALSRDDDAFILRFLRARKFDHEDALQMLLNFHKQTQSWPEVFVKVQNPTLVKHTFNAGCLVGLPGKAIDGSCIVIGRPGKGENPLLIDLLAVIALSVDQLLEEERNQIYGVTVIEDFAFFGMDMVGQLGPWIGKRFIDWIQDAMPMRTKHVNAVNEPKIFDVVFALFRPFLKERLLERFAVHGTNFDELHKIIDPANLPPAYGGSGPTLDDLSDFWKNVVLGEDTCL